MKKLFLPLMTFVLLIILGVSFYKEKKKAVLSQVFSESDLDQLTEIEYFVKGKLVFLLKVEGRDLTLIKPEGKKINPVWVNDFLNEMVQLKLIDLPDVTADKRFNYTLDEASSFKVKLSFKNQQKVFYLSRKVTLDQFNYIFLPKDNKIYLSDKRVVSLLKSPFQEKDELKERSKSQAVGLKK